MKERKYILSLITVYLCYFTQGIQGIILSQNIRNFYTQWGYSDKTAGAAAVSLAITAVGLGKFLTVWLGGEVSDKIGRKKMAVTGGLLYVICFAGLLLSNSFAVSCVCAFLSGVATSGLWDASLYPAAQEAAPKYAGSALIGIKLFVSLSGIIYPILAVSFTQAGNWHINIWIPLILSILCVVMALASPFVYDDEMKQARLSSGTAGTGEKRNAIQAEIDAAKARQRVKPNGMVNFITMFYGFLCMFIMYGAQQYTKAFGMTNCGLSDMQAAELASVYTFGSIISVIFWAIMMGKLRWNPLKVILIDSVFTTFALIIILLLHQVAVVFLAIALLGIFAAGGALQVGVALRQMFCPGPKGRNTGIYYTWMGLAAVALPFVVSAMTKTIGETSAIYVMMGLLLVAAIVATLMMLYLVGQYRKIYGESALTSKLP